MARFSRAHYRLVSPPEDTFRDVTERFARVAWTQAAAADVRRAFPVITAENFAAATRMLDERTDEYLLAVGIR